MNDPQAAKMLEFIATCDDPAKLRTIARNASEKGVEDVWRAAKLKLYEVLPSEKPGTIEYEVWQSIFALEDTLRDERGKTIRLSRTRQKIDRQGEISCIADLVMGKASDGFRMLADRDMLHLSFESIALRFPEMFEDEVLDAARSRLSDAAREQ